MSSRARAALTLAAAMSCGCPSGKDDAGGELAARNTFPPPRADMGASAPAPGTRALELLSEPWLQLGFTETSSVRVRLTDDEGAPIAGGTVTFALVSRSQDSSLAAVSATTDDDGVAENELIAGTMTATFSVRITAPGAYETFVHVGVSNSGFGTLQVQAAYTGERPVAQRVIFAQAEMDCDRATRMPGDPMVTMGPDQDSAQFVALPASVSYAILAFAESEDGRVVATGCSDGVVIERDDRVTATVAFADEPLALSGRFALQADLDVSRPATTLGGALRGGAETVVITDSLGNAAPMRAESRFLLDTLNSTLREDYAQQAGTIALADAIAAERATPTGDPPEQSLQTLLAIKAEGALSVAPRLVQLTATDLETLRLFVELSAEDDGELALTWRPLRVELLTAGDGREPVAIDLSEVAAAPAEAQAALIDGRDAIELESVRFGLPFGALAAQVLREVVSFDPSGHGEELRSLVGCTALAEWLAAQSYTQGGACDESCVRATCDRAVTRLVSGAETALIALDDARPTLILSGEIELGDADGDLQVELLSAQMLLGEWEPETDGQSGDAVSGAATAQPLAASAQQ